MAWMYLTPILYPLKILPERVQLFLKFNPLVYLVELFRMPIYDGLIPPLSMWLIGMAVAFTTLLLGWIAFAWKSDEFAYRV
jgi:ABC-type polysaccharide/polyol phosphate export permease